MKITLVVQRYGDEIVGGAERLCRGVAEGMAARDDHDVEVLTTCARSYVTWANAYPEGRETVAGVRIRRFRTERERDMADFNRLSRELFNGPREPEEVVEWLDAQGPYAPRLVDAVHGVADDRDALLFFTYLYYPTVHGIHAAPDRSVLVPTAHDEAPIYLDCYDPVFALPAGMVFNTRAEEAFVRRRFSRLPAATTVAGVGIDLLDRLDEGSHPVPGAGDVTRRAEGPDSPGGEGGSRRPGENRVPASGDRDGHGRDDAGGDAPPSLLYAGRIEAGKGVDRLIQFVDRYRRQSGRPLRLWLMGETAMALPDADWIAPLGFVPEAEKLERLRGATVLISPSALESFAIVPLEAMAVATPVLVDAASEAAVEHCRRAGAGLWYRDYPEFREALTLLLEEPRLRRALGARGSRYVRGNYTWEAVVDRYEGFLEELLG